jgi:hypothetical protein
VRRLLGISLKFRGDFESRDHNHRTNIILVDALAVIGGDCHAANANISSLFIWLNGSNPE